VDAKTEAEVVAFSVAGAQEVCSVKLKESVHFIFDDT
jgi:hypothetical protein